MIFKSSKRSIAMERVAIILIWCGIGVIFIAALLFTIINDLFHIAMTEGFDRFGQFGEFIGGIVGSLWALAGVILFYEALKFQRSELELQRRELEFQRLEIIEQTNQYRLQNKTLESQKSENTFFQLLHLHNEIVTTMEYHKINAACDQKQLFKGRECFTEFTSMFKTIYNDNIDLVGLTSPERQDMIDIINESFDQFYIKYQSHLSHYLHNLTYIFVFLEANRIIDRKFGLDLMRAQLTNDEQVLLFYYCIYYQGKEFKRLAEKYAIFSHIPVSALIDRRHMKLFDRYAFTEVTKY